MEAKLDQLSATLTQRPTYAQAARGDISPTNRTIPPPQAPTESAKQSKALRVRLADSSEALQIQQEPVETIIEALQQDIGETHAARSIIAAKKLPGGDILLHTSSVEAKQSLQRDPTWVKKLGTSAQLKQQSFPVLAHGVPTAHLMRLSGEERAKLL